MSYAMYDTGRPSQLHENAYTSRQLVGQGRWQNLRDKSSSQLRSLSKKLGLYSGSEADEDEMREAIEGALFNPSSSNSYKNMTLYQLREEARKKGISGFANARKPELIEALENNLHEVPYGMRDQGYKHEHGIGGSRVGTYGSEADGLENMTRYELEELARGKVPYSHKDKDTIIKELKKYYATGHAPGYHNVGKRVGAYGEDDTFDLNELSNDQLNHLGRTHGVSDYYTMGREDLINGLSSLEPSETFGKLQNMTLYDLKDLARQNGVAGYAHARKADLIKKLEDKGVVGGRRVGQARINNGLDGMTVAELKQHARDHGLTGYSKLRKSDLIKMIENEKYAPAYSARQTGRKVGCACSR